MLIEFSVTNFRSIREKQTFSMVAAPRLRKTENTFVPETTGEKLPRLLKVAAIYGPNASGKSNLTTAFAALSRIVAGKLTDDNDRASPVAPFRFDPALSDAPSEFEIHFIANKTRYEYCLAATQDRIVHERLIAYPKGKESLLFERQHRAGSDEYVFGNEFEREEFLRNAWKKLTGPRVTFLKQVAENSNEELTLVSAAYKCLYLEILSIGTNLEGISKKTREFAHRSSSFATDLSRFLQQIDVPVTKIQFETDHRKDDNLFSVEKSVVPKIKKTTLTHATDLGEAEFDYSEESEGTKALIGFWLPWAALGHAETTLTLIVDELDSSLHPVIVAELVARHIANDTSAQLIFTTHDTHLMDTKLLRRDQIWVTERDRNGATKLRSIHDFEGRESEDIEKRYYEGRYRGLPFIRNRRA